MSLQRIPLKSNVRTKTCRCCLTEKAENVFAMRKGRTSYKAVCNPCLERLYKLPGTDAGANSLCYSCGWYRPAGEFNPSKHKTECKSCLGMSDNYLNRDGYPSVVSKAMVLPPAQELVASVPQAEPVEPKNWDHIMTYDLSHDVPKPEQPIDRAQAVLWLCDQLREARLERDAAATELDSLGGELVFTQSKMDEATTRIEQLLAEQVVLNDQWVKKDAEASKRIEQLHAKIRELEARKPAIDPVTKEEESALSLFGFPGARRAS